MAQYYLVYKNPDVRYLRTLFDTYLGNEKGRDDEFMILKAWSSDYYRSRFVVLSRDQNPFGGTLITLIFPEKPDKIFIAWVYPDGSSRTLKLRVLDPTKYTEEDVRRTRTRYASILDDKKHAM